MSAPENPPAFPQQCADALDVGMVHEGMTLRDWFAGQALPTAMRIADLATAEHPEVSGADAAKSTAALAYLVADAMLVARTPHSTEER